MTLRHRHLACVGVSLNFGTRVVIPSFAVAPQPPPPFYLSHPACGGQRRQAVGRQGSVSHQCRTEVAVSC
jgi:hypothetical protein